MNKIWFLGMFLVFSRSGWSTEKLPELFEAPKIALTDQNGKLLDESKFKGKVWVADFFYTSCLHECLMMTSKLQNLQTKVKDLKGVEFVSITTDPKKDNPKKLKKYIVDRKIDEANWSFLTGDKKTIVSLATKGFKMALDEKSAVHSKKFVLIDQNNKVRGYYDSEEKNSNETLEADIRALLK